MRNLWNKLILRKITVILIVGLVFIIISLTANSSNETKSPNWAVQEYIRIIKDKDYDNSKQFFKNKDYIGNEPDKQYQNNYKSITLEEAEKQGIIGKKGIDVANKSEDDDIKNKDILLKQENKVETIFGAGAWDNIKYTLEKIDCPITEEKTIDKRTNEVLTNEEAQKINKEFWDNIFASEGIKPEYYNNFPFNANTISVEKADELYRIMAKHREESPIVSVYTPLYETYKVKFEFNNKKNADTGETDFNIVIMKKDDEWGVYTGLNWITPIPEPEEDI